MGAIMARLRVESFSISADGYGAGVEQSLGDPMGKGGMALHGWAFATRTTRAMFGMDGGDTGIDDRYASRGFDTIGAWILGRNMFAHSRGPWTDDGWRGWWGDNPVYHCQVFVLTHHARAPLVMAGGTTFHFVTEGIHVALARAMAAAGGRDVRVGGGTATVRAYLQAGLVDEMHLAQSPVLLGQGESLFAGLDLPALGYSVAETEAGEATRHLILRRV